MPKVSRIGDIGVGVCCCHKSCKGMTGIIITGSSDTITNNLRTSRLTDIVLGFCGHIGILVTGSPTFYVNSLPVTRIGDVFVGCFTGVIVTGSPDTWSDGY